MKVVTIHTGVLDSDYKKELKLMVSVSTPWSFKKGEKIAQLLLLPYIDISKSSNVRHGGFGSTNKQINYSTLIQEQNQPLCTLKINGKTFTGLLDSGADISIISSDQWPHTWPTKDVDFSIQEVGTMMSSQLQQSAQNLKCEGPVGLQGILQPYITPITMNLWG
jgi:hypothetical protein